MLLFVASDTHHARATWSQLNAPCTVDAEELGVDVPWATGLVTGGPATAVSRGRHRLRAYVEDSVQCPLCGMFGPCGDAAPHDMPGTHECDQCRACDKCCAKQANCTAPVGVSLVPAPPSVSQHPHPPPTSPAVACLATGNLAGADGRPRRQ